MKRANANPLDPESRFDDDEKQLRNLDPAWAKAAHYFRTGFHYGHPEGSIRCRSLLDIHREVEGRRKRFEAGDTMEVLHAVKLCADENLPLPTWAALAFGELFGALGKLGGPMSLDAIFHSRNLPTKTPTQAAQAKIDWQVGAALWKAVWEVADQHAGLDTALDAVLAAGEYGVKKTKARKLVNMIDETHTDLLGQESLSRFWAKRRKQ